MESGIIVAYGTGTQSWLKSTEYRQLKKERERVTAAFVPSPESVEMPLTCRCPQRSYPHEVSVHATLRTDWAAWGAGQDKNRWPWSLRLLEAYGE